MAEPAASPRSAWKAKEIAVLEAPAQVAAARFSPCGRWLAAADFEGRVLRWDFSLPHPLPAEPLGGHRGWAQRLAWLADGTLLSVDSWGGLLARPGDSADAAPRWLHEQAHDGWIYDLAVDRESRRAATVGRDGMLRLWNAVTGELAREWGPFEHELRAAAIDAENDLVVAGDARGLLRGFRLSSGETVGEHPLPGMHYYDRIQDVPGLFSLQFLPDGALLAAGGRPTRIQNHHGHPVVYRLARLSDPEPEVLYLSETENDGFVFDLAWLGDEHFAAVTSGAPGRGQFLLHRAGEKAPYASETRMANCHTLALHPDRRRLVVSATNRNSQGNGAVRDKEGRYVANYSPLHVFELQTG